MLSALTSLRSTIGKPAVVEGVLKPLELHFRGGPIHVRSSLSKLCRWMPESWSSDQAIRHYGG